MANVQKRVATAKDSTMVTVVQIYTDKPVHAGIMPHELQNCEAMPAKIQERLRRDAVGATAKDAIEFKPGESNFTWPMQQLPVSVNQTIVCTWPNSRVGS